MAYKLAEEDKLCGVIYPTYEGFKPIPKATCEMLESKCEQTIIVTCKDNQSEEDKKPESQSGSASTSASESSSESTSTSESNSVSESTSESTSAESTSVSESTTESTTTSESTSVSTSESASSSIGNSNTPEDKVRSLKDSLSKLLQKVQIGALTHINGNYYTYDPKEGLDIYTEKLNKYIEKAKEDFPGYNITYKIVSPEVVPTSIGDKNDKNKYLVKFVVTKGEDSFEVKQYVDYAYYYYDVL